MTGAPRQGVASDWRAAAAEADGALVCLQSGLPVQAAEHARRGLRLLRDEAPEQADERGAEQLTRRLARGQGLAGRLAARRELRRLMRELRRHPGRREQAGPGALDRLQGRQRLVAAGVFMALVVLMALWDSGPAAPEERSVGGVLRAGGPELLELTLDQVQAKLPPGPFSHLAEGFRFREQVTITLGAPKPMYALTIGLRNAMIHRVSLWRGDRLVHRFYLGPRAVPIGLFKYELDLAGTDAQKGVDRIVVHGVEGEGTFELGQVTIEDWR